MLIRLPIDFQESLVFRRLAEWLAAGLPISESVIRANYLFVTIWRDLAYLARDGRDPGRVTPEDVQFFQATLAKTTSEPDKLWGALAEELRFFIRDGADLVCPLFAEFNGNLGPSCRSKEARGGDMKAFYAGARRAETDDFQQMILIQPDKLTDRQGQPLAAEMIRRVKWLIAVCDNALFKPVRSPYHYSQELIQNAAEILAATPDRQALDLCTLVAKNRSHPALQGMTTEKLLTEFPATIGKLRGR